jgi:hypothetical protein
MPRPLTLAGGATGLGVAGLGEAINQEANLLLAAARQASVEERRALQNQCAALIERRNTAIRNLIRSAFPLRDPIAKEKPAELTGLGIRSTDARAAGNSSSLPELAKSSFEKNRALEIDAECRERADRRLDQLRPAQKETVGLNRSVCWVSEPAEDDCPTVSSQGIDKKFVPQARKLGVFSDEKFEEAG